MSKPTKRVKATEDKVIRELEVKLIEATNLKERADLIVGFCLKFRGVYQDYRSALIKNLIRAAEKQNNHYALGSAYTALTWGSIDMGKYKKGAIYAQKAQEQYRLAGEKQKELKALNGEASALKASGKFDQALNKYLDGLEQAKEMEDKPLIRLFLTNLGGLMNSLGQYDEAILYFKELFELAPEEEQDVSEFYMMGLPYLFKGDFEQAEPLFLKGAELSEKQGELYLNALCKYRLGQIKIAGGLIREGEELIQKVLAASKELKIPTLKTNALVELGEIEEQRKNHEKALDYALKATEIAKATEGKESLLKKMAVLAKIQGSVGDYEKAYSALQETRELELEQYNNNLINSLKMAKALQVRRENKIYKTLYERINTISQIGQAITSTFELKEIGEIIWDNLKSLMPVDTLAIGLYDKKHEALNYQIFIQEGQFLEPIKPPN